MDLNSDGYLDILSGSYSRMGQPMAGLFQVLWGKAGNQFQPAAELQGTDKEPLIIPIKDPKSEMTRNICTRPTAIDWNGDGKLDLLVGNFEGTFYLFLGEGRGQFAPKAEPLMAGKDRLRIEGGHSDPFIVDWDGDGDLDLISGSDHAGVQWAENTAGPGKLPALKPFKPLIPLGRDHANGELLDERDLTGPSRSMRVWADDFDGDGKLDLLVGDNVTLVAMAKGVNKKQYDQKLSAWEKAFETARQNMEKATGEAQRTKAQKRFQQLYEQRSEFMNEQATGYVWFFRRK